MTENTKIIPAGGAALATSESRLDALFSEWFSFIEVKPKTAETYRRAIDAFRRYTAANGIRDPRREDIIAWKEELLNGEKKHTAGTVQLYLTAVKVFFKWAAYMGYYENVAQYVKAVRVGRDHKKDPLTAAQAAEVANHISGNGSNIETLRNLAIYLLLAQSGLRSIEIIRADVADFRQSAGAMILYVHGKGRDDKSDFVTLSDDCEKALRAYLKERGNVDGDAPLFAGHSNRNNGKRLSTRTIRGIIKSEFRAVGLDNERITTHSLRHFAATEARRNGADLEAVQQLLRQADPKTTQIYDSHLAAASNRVPSIVAESMRRAGAAY